MRIGSVLRVTRVLRRVTLLGMADRVTSVRLPEGLWLRIEAELRPGQTRNRWIREAIEAALPAVEQGPSGRDEEPPGSAAASSRVGAGPAGRAVDTIAWLRQRGR